jgi:hypothetical protein
MSLAAGFVLMIAWFLLTSVLFWRFLFLTIVFAIIGFLTLVVITNLPSDGPVNIMKLFNSILTSIDYQLNLLKDSGENN